MKIIKLLDKKTRLIQSGKIPNVNICLQRKKWWGWKTINRVGTFGYNTIDEFEKVLLEDEKRREKPYYGRIINPPKF
jgi:hypothetical protein